MIDEVLVFLKNQLKIYLQSGQNPDDPQEDPVVFLEGDKMDPVTFKLGAISILLINVEEENQLRPADRYLRYSPNGVPQKIKPDIRLSLYVLFVAHFKQYDASLRYLSQVIRYFQKYPVFNHDLTPELNDNIEKLILELVTLPFSEQNEIWNALRVAYHPSVLYKVKMIVYEDEEGEELVEVKERVLDLNKLNQ